MLFREKFFAAGSLLAVCILLLPGCATTESRTIVLTEKDAAQTIQVKQNDLIRIELAGNPTTGYMWQSDGVPDMNVLRLVEEDYVVPPSNGMVGVPGKKIFLYKAVEPGRAGIKLVYRRPWEHTASDQRFQLAVIVLQEKRFFADLLDLNRGTQRVGANGEIEPLPESARGVYDF